MMKIWIVDGTCTNRTSVMDSDGPWSYHMTEEGANNKMKELLSDPEISRKYMFEIKQVDVVD